ncbi:MAG: type II toxin-antitoxin system VapC family toxin [Hormoscilla sp. GM7CHS1pb]|nr:type II toxin-antitoxin system VapC family toxin [Hormoscilla sp. GM7CHS1pb]
MRICIDSSTFIPGLQKSEPDKVKLLRLVRNNIHITIPRLIAKEVTRNLVVAEEVREFYRLFQEEEFGQIIDEPIPSALVEKYINLGLPAKADAFIGAFAEWMNVNHLISENRHFLRELQTTAFEIVNAAEFIKLLEDDA